MLDWILLNISVNISHVTWFWLVAGCIATWRITSIIHVEGIAAPIRRFFGGVHDSEGNIKYNPLQILGRQTTFFAELFSCFWCLSVWIGAAVTIIVFICPYILLPFVMSAVAIILEKIWDT